MATDRRSGWDDARRAQIRAFATSTPVRRLEWLEEAVRLAHATGALARADTPERRRRRGIRAGDPE